MQLDTDFVGADLCAFYIEAGALSPLALQPRCATQNVEGGAIWIECNRGTDRCICWLRLAHDVVPADSELCGTRSEMRRRGVHGAASMTNGRYV